MDWDLLGHLSMVSDSWFGLGPTVCLGRLSLQYWGLSLGHCTSYTTTPLS